MLADKAMSRHAVGLQSNTKDFKLASSPRSGFDCTNHQSTWCGDSDVDAVAQFAICGLIRHTNITAERSGKFFTKVSPGLQPEPPIRVSG